MNRKTLTWAIVIFLLPVLACGLGGGGSEGASSEVSLGADATEAPTPTQPPVVEDVEEVSEAEAPAEPQAAPFNGVLGVEQLDSFRANILMEISGARGESTGDETTEQRQEYMLEVTKNPPARHQITSIKSEGAIEADAETEYYMIDDITYTNAFDNWIAQSGLVGKSQFASLGAFAMLPETAICNSEPEEVNGISTIHCTFSEEDNLPESLDAASIQGDVWIAEEGNFVVKYELEAQDLNLKGGFKGFTGYESYNISYELSDINSDISIDLPAEAQDTQVIDTSDGAGSSGLAAPPGAEVFIDAESSLNYFSTADLTELVDFHRENLTAAGWQEVPDESYVTANTSLLVFENETGLMRVFIQEDVEGGYFVSMTLPFDETILGSGEGGDSSGGASPDTTSSEFPVLDDATELFATGQVTTYYTESDIEAVIDFYRTELPAQGWTEDTGTSFSNESTALLTFEQEGATLTVAVNQESEGRVNVSLIQQ